MNTVRYDAALAAALVIKGLLDESIPPHVMLSEIVFTVLEAIHEAEANIMEAKGEPSIN